MQATGALAVETAAINKSLSALGDVMTAIAAKEAHVPYRNSKLTFLLQPALSRGTRVMFIVTASPGAPLAHRRSPPLTVAYRPVAYRRLPSPTVAHRRLPSPTVAHLRPPSLTFCLTTRS